MKFFKILLPLAALSSSYGAFSYTITVGALYDSNGNDLAPLTVGVLVVSTSDAVFPQGDQLLGRSLTQYANWGSDDYVAAVLTTQATLPAVSGDPKSPQSQFSTTTSTIDYAQLPGGNVGDKVMLYWFPAIQDTDSATAGIQFTSQTIRAGESYGAFRSDQVANIGITGITSTTNNAFVTPADLTAGFRVTARNVDALTAAQETQMGTNYAPSVADLTANLTVGAVPEPSTYALMGLGLVVVGLVARRKKA